jgi:hypothetical protein
MDATAILDRRSQPDGGPAAAPDPSAFASILFPDGRKVDGAPEPVCFHDLNLDQIVATVAGGRAEYDLTPFFRVPAGDLATIVYRHEVFHDVDDAAIASVLDAFAIAMRSVRASLAEAGKLYYRLQKQIRFLEAGIAYGDAIGKLSEGLAKAELRSQGLSAFRAFLAAYVRSPRFVSLTADGADVAKALAAIRYSLLIRDSSVQVRAYADELDYAASVTESFEKFQQGKVDDYAKKFPDFTEMNHVEAGILEYVAKLNPDAFGALDGFCRAHGDFLDPTVTRFDREIQFYAGWRAHRARIEAAGLSFCYPEVSDTDKQVSATAGFDLALADKLLGEGAPVVTNDFALKDPERSIVVSGPNQGGKTTFARMFGQMNYLAALGCPIPGKAAKTFLFDQLFTHFEREEDISTERGKLEDDLFRIHEILEKATPRSIIVMNEIFTSTTLADAIVLGKRVMERILDLDILSVCVTFIDELAGLGPKVVSMASTVVPDDPARRTFKIIRKPADGKAYAVFVAERYGLTFDQIRERLS